VATPTLTFTILQLNLRDHYNPYQLPAVETVIKACQTSIPKDEAMVLQPLKGAGTGIYRLILTKPVDPQGITVVLPKGEGTVSVILTEPPVKGAHNFGRREGLLITFLNAAAGPNTTIPAALFDQAVKQYGEIIKGTDFQKFKGTSMFNGNRYCVIDCKNKDVVPGSISITNPSNNQVEEYYIRFRGQTWYCKRCNAQHTGPCPALQAFFQAKEQRDAITATTKIYTDSTLRRAERVGIKADISCMPGGGIGEVANSLLGDPNIDTMQQVVILAGYNDVKNTALPIDTEFVFAVESAVEKIVNYAKQPNKSCVVVNMTTPRTHTWEDDSDQGRRQRFIDHRWALVDREPNRVIVHTLYRENYSADDSGHPDEAGTQDLIRDIDKLFKGSLILDPHHLTAQRLYQGVEAVYKYGCKACGNDAQYPPKGLCPGCEAEGRKFHSPHWAAIKAWQPLINPDGTDVDKKKQGSNPFENDGSCQIPGLR
jgi:hypothetical protein